MSEAPTPTEVREARKAAQQAPIEAEAVDLVQETNRATEPSTPPNGYEIGKPNEDTVMAVMRQLAKRTK